MKRKTGLSVTEQRNRTLEFVTGLENEGIVVRLMGRNHLVGDTKLPLPSHGWCVGTVTRTKRLFLKGDLVFIEAGNGTERFRVFGVSGRGYCVKGYSMETNREEKNRGDVLLLDLPDELLNKKATDPAIPGFIAALRAE